MCIRDRDLCVNGVGVVDIQSTNFQVGSGVRIGWASTADAHLSGPDTAFSRIGAASLTLGNETAGDFSGSLKLTNLTVDTGTIQVTRGTEQAGFGAIGSEASINTGILAGSTTAAIKFKTSNTVTMYLSNTTQLTLASGGLFGFSNGATGNGTIDTGISRLAPNSVAVGNGTQGDVSGGVTLATVTEQSANGAQWVLGQASELLTLSTVAAFTDTVGNLLPANGIIESVVARLTTGITLSTNWQLGDATTPGRFSAPNSTMTAGTTQVGLVHVDQTGAAGPRQTTAAKVRVTMTGIPGAGAVRITVFYRQFTPPTS